MAAAPKTDEDDALFFGRYGLVDLHATVELLQHDRGLGLRLCHRRQRVLHLDHARVRRHLHLREVERLGVVGDELLARRDVGAHQDREDHKTQNVHTVCATGTRRHHLNNDCCEIEQ